MFSKFLDPKNDVAFRKIFGSEQNKDILIHFINDILVFKESSPVVNVTFLKTIQDPEIATKKSSIVDVLCHDEKGNKYIVEMQVAKEKGFEKRAQYYAAKAYSNQANVGDLYENLKEIVFIAIADFVVFDKKEGYKSDHVILDRNSFEHDLKDFSFTFLELPKFKKTIDQLKTITDKWMYFFNGCEDTSPEDLAKIIGSDMILERAYHELDRHYWSEEELLSYEQSKKYIGAYNASMRQKYDEGIAKGEDKKAIEIARKMIARKRPLAEIIEDTGLSKEDILKYTGLSVSEIEKL
jgi:predicted transposase/invertase (TIGR01784 family)